MMGDFAYDCMKEGINVHAFNILICYTYSSWTALFTRSPNDRQFPDCVWVEWTFKASGIGKWLQTKD